MIKIQTLHVEHFRGIRNLQLPIAGENLAVKGANGSGKSGVIDAVEFALTGNITRLTGLGSGAVSIKSHAPHVDCKDSPEKAKVILTLRLPSGTVFNLERTVAAPSKPILNPDNDETRAALAFISGHPEFSLSRREILKFVLTEAGKRAKEVQALLKLDAIDKNRAAFQTTANTAARDEKTAEALLNSARANLLSHLKISELKKDLLLEAVNQRRSILGLKSFSELTADIKVSDGIVSDSKDPKTLIPRADAIARVDKAIGFADGSAIKETPQVKKGLEAVTKLKGQPEALSSLSRQSLFESGVDLISDDSCPLCDLEWEQPKLLQHLKDKISKNKEAAGIKATLVAGSSERSGVLRSLGNEFEQFSKYAVTLGLEAESQTLSDNKTTLHDTANLISRPIENLETVETVFTAPQTLLAPAALTALQTLKTELQKLPDLSASEAAKQYLTIADERLSAYRKAKIDHELQKTRSATAAALLKHFMESSESKLSKLYDEVQNDFARFYRQLNKEDEGNFSARLQPSDGVLNFEVDFYGRGKFPPNAYHSEGHQDGMGLCLYFALSKKLLGKSFSLCLLDDVLMSVDSEHRREVCKLLRAEFPDTQFVLTTHDEVWSKQLTLEGLIKGKNLLQFRKWTVDDGPAAWDFGEVWKEIEDDIATKNISGAAHGLRRYLEFLMAELAFKLRANIEARPGANYDLGELTPAVASRFKELLKKAKVAANSWNRPEIVAEAATFDDNFGGKYAATNAEQWAVNASVHYNEWANLSPGDFRGVLKSFQALLEALKCAKCGTWFYVMPIKGTVEMLRCECGQTSLNLKPKST